MTRAAVLAGLGGWLPPVVRTNEALCAHLDSSPEWIEKRTGIRQRHLVSRGMSTSDLAVHAGTRVLESLDDPRVDALVLATTSPDRLCPATAPEVAARLGCGMVPAFDVTAACSGFLYGLAASAGLIAAGVAERVLFVGADAFSTLVNPEDRTTAPIFGDGAGAVLLRSGTPGEPGAIGPFVLGSDGARGDLLAVPAGGSRQRSTNGLGHQVVPAGDWYLGMNGRAVFQHAVQRMTESARTVLDRAGWTPGDVDRFVGHQANVRILDVVAARLDIPTDRVVVNIDHVANTLAASVPLALTDAVTRGELRPGDRVLLSAFGAGFTWGATVLIWPSMPTPHPLTRGAPDDDG
jgi:3-oxoacyl-[acyl-carrier-protein] synthase-3